MRSVYKYSDSEEFQYMLKRWPNAACHDDINYFFPDVHPNADNPILVDSLTTKEAAVILFNTDRDRAIHISTGSLNKMHNTAVWRLWCGKYMNVKCMKDDVLELFGKEPNYNKSMKKLTEEHRLKVEKLLLN